VAEFAKFHFVVTPAQHVDHVKSVLQLCPKGSKVLSRRLWKWGKFRAEQFAGKCQFLGLTEQELLEDTTVECHHVGTPHEPLDFLGEALAAGHPKDLRRHVDPALHEVILDNFHRPPHLLAQRRIEFLKKYTELAQQCKPEELKLRLKMPAYLRQTLVGKRLILFGRMLSDLGFPDKRLVEDIASGFKLSGWMPDSELFPRQVKSPTLTQDARENQQVPLTTRSLSRCKSDKKKNWNKTPGTRLNTSCSKVGFGKINHETGQEKQ
jgi:hypothetical protein